MGKTDYGPFVEHALRRLARQMLHCHESVEEVSIEPIDDFYREIVVRGKMLGRGYEVFVNMSLESLAKSYGTSIHMAFLARVKGELGNLEDEVKESVVKEAEGILGIYG